MCYHLGEGNVIFSQFPLTRLFFTGSYFTSEIGSSISADLVTRASVLKIRRVERHEVVIVQLSDDVLYWTQFDALLARLVTILVIDVGVPAEWDLQREVSTVGDDAEVKVASKTIVISRIDLVDLDDEPRGIVGRHVRDDAQRGSEIFQGLIVAGIKDDLRPGLGDDA